MIETIGAILVAALAAGTPLVLASLGELVTERAGVLNLGVEGMMLVGAVTGFIAATESGSLWVGVGAAIAAGAALSVVFGVLTQLLLANQVASGLALSIFGIGLSAFLGLNYTGESFTGFGPIGGEWSSSLPVVGPFLAKTLLALDVLIYVSFAIFAVLSWFLSRTKAGLVLRAVGENPSAAHALGYSVVRIRFGAVLFGGAMAGLGGGYLSLAYTPLWSEEMTAGRGWIALALVVFATWRPARVLVGAYLFGGITIAQLHAQSTGLAVPSELLSALPYLATIIVLVVISNNRSANRETRAIDAPRALGKAYHPRFDN